ncbi:MAG: hypothetical protein Q9195_005236 [Heterodermia aff. obscurata]
MAKNTPIMSKPPKKMRVKQSGVKKSGRAKLKVRDITPRSFTCCKSQMKAILTDRYGKMSSLFRRFVNSRSSMDSSIQDTSGFPAEAVTTVSVHDFHEEDTESELEGFSDPNPELGQAVGGDKGQEVSNYFLQSTDEPVYIIAPCKNLTHAGDELANFFDTNVESAHEDDALPGVAALFYWIAVFETCNNMAEFFENADQAQRLKLWSDIYDLAPLQMAKASLTGLTEVFTIEEIYSWDGDEH